MFGYAVRRTSPIASGSCEGSSNCATPGESPRSRAKLLLRFPCGSVSISRMRRLSSSATAANNHVACVLPTPPFKFRTVSTLADLGVADTRRIVPCERACASTTYRHATAATAVANRLPAVTFGDRPANGVRPTSRLGTAENLDSARLPRREPIGRDPHSVDTLAARERADRRGARMGVAASLPVGRDVAAHHAPSGQRPPQRATRPASCRTNAFTSGPRRCASRRPHAFAARRPRRTPAPHAAATFHPSGFTAAWRIVAHRTTRTN